MKKLCLLLASLLVSACVTSNPQKSSLSGNLPAEGLTTETHGLLLEKNTTQRVALEITKVSEGAKFTKIVQLLPGENMRNAYQPAVVTADQYIIGVNGKLAWESQDELLNAINEAYKSNSMIPMHVIDPKTGKLQNVFISDGHSLNDLALTPATLTTDVSTVKEAAAGSWAERNGLKVGDEILGSIRFRTVTTHRESLLFMSYVRSETSTKEVTAGNPLEVMGFVNTMFRGIKPFKPTAENRDGVTGDFGLLQLAVVRDRRLMQKDLSHSRYVGLGVQFNCEPYCGGAEPVITAMRKNSAGSRSGLQIGDLVLSVNGNQVRSSWKTMQKIRKLNYGDTAAFRVMRNKQPVDVTAKIDWVVED